MKDELPHIPTPNPHLLNTELPYIMHIDLNSCFAIVEQQANRLLRGRPVGVPAYDTPRGMIIASSYEAKAKGVKLGVNVAQARALAPGIVVMTPDPAKYREAHKLFKEVLLEYSPDVTPKSIDEFILDLRSSPALRRKIVEAKNKLATKPGSQISNIKSQISETDRLIHNDAMQKIAQDIKIKIAERLGEWVTVNIGIGPNRFLAKYAAGFGKPDGMTLIDHVNLVDYYRCRTPQTCASLSATASNATKRIDGYGEVSSASGQARNSQETGRVLGSDQKQAGRCEACGGVQLVDLPGINTRYRARLRIAGIYTPLDFLDADMQYLKKQVFKSINGYHWYRRLRGYEADAVEFSRKSIGHQYALSKKTDDVFELEKLLIKLCEKTGRRLRRNNYYAGGIHLYLGFESDQPYLEDPASFEHMHKIKSWHHGEKVYYRLYSTQDIYEAAKKLLHSAVNDDEYGGAIVADGKMVGERRFHNRIRIMGVNVFELHPWQPVQLSLFDAEKPQNDNPNKPPMKAIETGVRSMESGKRVSDAVDAINNRYGEFVVTPAMMIDMQGTILDRIAFGQVSDL